MNLDTYLSTDLPHLGFLQFIFIKKPPEVIFEIGACEGEDSERYSKLFPHARLYLFEPVATNAQIIRSKIISGKIKNAELFEVAVADYNAESEIYESSGRPEYVPLTDDWNYGNKSSSLLKPLPLMNKIHKWLRFQKKHKVQVVTLESIANQTDISSVDFIHMDVQGAEMMVLKGAGDFLKKVSCIWLEVVTQPIYESQVCADQIQEFLKKMGFLKVFESISGGSGDHFYVNPKKIAVEHFAGSHD